MSEPSAALPARREQLAERISEAIRAAGIAYHREHDAEWRNNPWKDGISVDLDEDDVLDTLTSGVLNALDPLIKPLLLAAVRAGRWVPQGDLRSGCVLDHSDSVRDAVLDAAAPFRTQAAASEVP